MEGLKEKLETIVKETDWHDIMTRVGPVKQIEIRAEIQRAIVKIDKCLCKCEGAF